MPLLNVHLPAETPVSEPEVVTPEVKSKQAPRKRKSKEETPDATGSS